MQLSCNTVLGRKLGEGIRGRRGSGGVRVGASGSRTAAGAVAPTPADCLGADAYRRPVRSLEDVCKHRLTMHGGLS